jgi:hypothetical protein
MSYQPDNTRTIQASFVGASSANGSFSDQIDSPEVLGRIDVGLQLFRAGGLELKGEYTADVGGAFLSHPPAPASPITSDGEDHRQ